MMLFLHAHLIGPLALSVVSSPGSDAGAFGAGSARTGVVHADTDPGPLSLDAPAWAFPASDPGVAGPIAWDFESAPVIAGDLVLALSNPDPASGTPASRWAVRRDSGRLAWRVEVPAPVLGSWSSPAVDRANRTVIVAAGRGGSGGGLVQARRLIDGSLAWQTELPRDVVNATVLVTTDRAGRDRAFITDYEGFFLGGSGAALHAINIDPRADAADPDGTPTPNPFEPGHILWSAPLTSGASGATPAYDGSRVYVATAGDFDFAGGGAILAFDADTTTPAPPPVWRTELGGDDGCFGGVSVTGKGVYAATYDFFGSFDSARLLRLDARTGMIDWAVPCARTASIPLVLPDGRVVLSAGLNGFGSVPTVQVFEPFGPDGSGGALRTADAALDTWADDGNGAIEPGEFLSLGGWSHHPRVVSHADGRATLLVGTIGPPAGPQAGSVYTRLSLVDLGTRSAPVPFGHPASVRSSFDGAGSSPTVLGSTAYTLGPGGLVAFGLPPRLDVNTDGRTDIDDLYAWHAGTGQRDVDRDGAVTEADRRTLEAELRRFESADMLGGVAGTPGGRR